MPSCRTPQKSTLMPLQLCTPFRKPEIKAIFPYVQEFSHLFTGVRLLVMDNGLPLTGPRETITQTNVAGSEH